MAIDVSQLRGLARDLSRVGPEVVRGVPPVVKKGALNVKNTMQADFSGSTYFKQVGRTVSFDVRSDGGGVEAEIGPDKARGGSASLAHFAYFGGARGGGGTVRDPEQALAEEGPRFEDALGKLVDGVL